MYLNLPRSGKIFFNMNNIYCENPIVIWHPHAAKLVQKYRTFTMPSGVYHSNVLHVNKNHVTKDNIDKYTIVNPATGETFPMFLIVPCSKCRLCNEKKAQAWSFRALCESYMSKSQAYFITLTYNNQHLPPNGVFAEEVQLFFKRLRIRLDRMGIEHNLRYIAVSEYGHYSKRPHYHIILWNFPDHFGTAYSRLSLIESAWRRPTGEYNTDGSPITESIGFAYCLPVIQGGINYVMKYMSKREKSPEGMNPTFMLASKKNGGIGSAYAEKLRSFYEQNPDTCDMSVINIYTGQSLTVMLPRYYRQKYMPSCSLNFNPDFIRHFKDTVRWFETARYIHRRYNLPFKFTYPKEYLYLVRSMSKTSYYQTGKFVINDTFITSYIKQFLSSTTFEDLYYKSFTYALDSLATALVFFNPDDCSKLDKSIYMNSIQTTAINARMLDRIECNIKKAAYDVQQRLYNHYRKERI